jgi:putative flippase GtrA
MTQSSIQKVKTITKSAGKYGATSVIATSADFAVFHFFLTYIGTTAVQSTLIGRCCGAIVAFLFHRNWVFRDNVPLSESNPTFHFNVLVTRYLSGVLLGMGLNVAGVWLLNTIFELNPWVSRITTAACVWFLVFQYNKNIVFFKGQFSESEKIISEQDFTDIEEDNIEG